MNGASLKEVLTEATLIARQQQRTVDIRYYRVGNKRIYYSVFSTEPLEPKHVHAASIHCNGRIEA